MEAQVTEHQDIPAAGLPPERDPELGLRELAPRDYLIGSVAGAALAAVMYLLGRTFAPQALFLPLAVLGFGMGFLGYLDQATRIIRNGYNLIFAVVMAGLLAVALAPSGPAAWIPALIGAAGTFIFLLVLSAITGFAGGGDIKLSPMPAAALAACFPLTAVLWLWFTFCLVLIGQIGAKIKGSNEKHTAMAPFMAAAMIPALVLGGYYQQSLMLL
jgi:hypothetical protein